MGVFGLWPVWRYSILKADLGKKSEMVVGDSRKMEFKIHQQPWEVTSLSPDQPVPLSEGPTGTVKEVAVMLQPWTLGNSGTEAKLIPLLRSPHAPAFSPHAWSTLTTWIHGKCRRFPPLCIWASGYIWLCRLYSTLEPRRRDTQCISPES